MRRRVFASSFLALGLSLVGLSTASSQTAFPTRSIQMVIPFAPGASNDIIGRYLAQQLSAKWGQPIIPANKPGAGSAIGSEFVVRSKSDGYTWLFASSTYTTNAAASKELAFDPLADLVPVAIVAKSDLLLVVGKHLNVKSVSDFIELAKQRELFYGAVGVGGNSDFGMSLFNSVAGVKMQRVVYKGGSEVLIDILAGRIDAYMGTIAASLPFAQANKVVALAVVGSQRMANLPDVQTLKESGMNEAISGQWWAVFVPKGTEKSIIEKINSDASEVFFSDNGSRFLASQDAVPERTTPEQAARYVHDELNRWKQLVTQGLIQLQ